MAGGVGGVVEEGQGLSTDNNTVRRLHELHVKAVYFDAPHHGSSESPYHVEIKTVWVYGADAIDKANLTRHVGSAATLGPTPTDSIPAPPDMTLLFLFLSKEKRDSFFGDLQERYKIILKVKGSRSAAI